MKKELIWWPTIFLTALFIVGQMSGFQFGPIDIQLHDTYFVFPAYLGVLALVVAFVSIRGVIFLANILTNKSKVAAVSVSILNSLLILTLLYVIFIVVVAITQLNEWHTRVAGRNYLGIVLAMTVALIACLLFQIKTVRKIKSFPKSIDTFK